MKTNFVQRWLKIGLSMLIVAFALNANATSYFEDMFNYDNNLLEGNPTTATNKWTVTATAANAKGFNPILTASTLSFTKGGNIYTGSTTGKQVILDTLGMPVDNTDSRVSYMNFGTTLTAGDVVYVAFLVNFEYLNAGGWRDFFTFNYSTGNNIRGRVYVRPSGNDVLIGTGINASPTVTDTATKRCALISKDETHLIVLKYMYKYKSTNDSLIFIIDPDLTATEPTAGWIAKGVSENATASGINQITIRQRKNFLASLGALRVGSTWADVVKYTAAAADVTPPTLAASNPFSPANGATNVAVDADITATFSEAVKAGTGTIQLVNETDANAVVSASVSYNGSIMTITPASVLPNGKVFHVAIPAGAVTDLAGNAFAGISNTDWVFTTTAQLSSDKNLTALTVTGQRGSSVYSNDSVFISVPPTNNKSALKIATLTIPETATASVNGNKVDVDSTINATAGDVTILITAQDASTKNYTLRVSNAADTQNELLTFKIGSTNGVIRNDSVLVTLPASTTSRISLVATFTKSTYATVYAVVSGNDSLQTSGTTANDFTNTVIYKVKSEDNVDHEYKVVVSIAAKPKGLIYEDNFATGYTVGQKLNGQNDWFIEGTPDSVMKVVATKLDYASYAPAGVSNSVNVNYPTISGGSVVLAKALPNSISADTIYMSCMVKITESQTGSGFIGFYENTPGSQRSRIWFKRNGSSAGNSTGVYFGVTRNSGTAANADYETTPTSVPYGATALVVLKQIFVAGAGNDIVQIFINPTPGAAEPTPNVTAVNASTGADPVQLDGIYIRANGSNPLKFMVGGIRVATNWAEAVKYGEPAGAPTVEALSPTTGSTTAAYGSNPVVTFNKAVKAGTGNITIKNYSTDATIGTYSVTNSEQVTFSGKAMTIHAAPLTKGVKMYVEIPSGAVLDNSNTAYAGTTDKDTWAFTAPKSNACTITAYSVKSSDGVTYTGVITGTSIAITTAEIIDFVTDTFKITVSPFANCVLTTNNYNSGTGAGTVIYTVTAEDGTNQVYTATFGFTPQSNFLTYSIGSAVGKINTTTKVVSVSLPNNATVSSLVATFTVSPGVQSIVVGSTAQVSGTTANNFTDTVRYRITASDNSHSDWKVIARVRPVGLLLEEYFKYPSGQLLKNVSTAWKDTIVGAVPSSYANTSDVELTYPNYAPSHDSLTKSYQTNWNGGSGLQANNTREFSAVDINADSIYLAFLISVDSVTAASGNEFIGLGLNLKSAAYTRLYFKKNSSGLNFKLGLRKNTSSLSAAPTEMWYSEDLTRKTTYLMVLKYSFATGYASAFLNPTVGIGEGEAPENTPILMDNTTSNTGNIPFTALRTISIRQNGSGTSRFKIGGIRVATSWNDAVKMGNIPETGSDFENYTLIKESLSWTGNINKANATIEVKVRKDVDLASDGLVAEFDLSLKAKAYIGNVEQESGITANLFADLVMYEVRPFVGTPKMWTVSVSHQGDNTAAEKNPMNISVHPNPVVSELHISANENLALVSVYNMAGTLIMEQANPGNVVNLGVLGQGIYFVKFVGQSGKITTVKIIK